MMTAIDNPVARLALGVLEALAVIAAAALWRRYRRTRAAGAELARRNDPRRRYGAAAGGEG